MNRLSHGSMVYLDALAAAIERHDIANGYSASLKELSLFVEYLGPRGFDMSKYKEVLERETARI